MVARPHGGRLITRVASDRRKKSILGSADEFPWIRIGIREAYDVENIGYGVYSPLDGFMVSEDLEHVLMDMRLANDLPWAIPIVVSVGKTNIYFGEGDEVLLVYGGRPLAVMEVEEIYRYDKKLYAEMVFETTDSSHPGVYNVFNEMGSLLVGGRIEMVDTVPNPYQNYYLRPIETRVLFKERGWKTVVGFQTRNAPHLGHEYVQKTALSFVDGIFINPVIGRKKRGDFKDEVILEAYSVLVKNYYPRDSAVLSIVRYEMRYAGPREAIHHAIMRKNFGCTHFIVGRDHAGVGKFYGPYEAQEIFKEFPDLGVTPVFFKEFFYCRKCGGIVHEKICPHEEEYRFRFSGTFIRNAIRSGSEMPNYIIRPEVAKVLLSHPDPFV